MCYHTIKIIADDILAVSDAVFEEIAASLQSRPERAATVNSTFMFLIKLEGVPVKRWCEYCRQPNQVTKCESETC